MIYQTRYLDGKSEIVWQTNINALSAEEAVATTVFFEWAPGSQSVQIIDPAGVEVYLISKASDPATPRAADKYAFVPPEQAFAF